MDMVTASPPVSPRVVQRILMIQKEKVTAATLLRPLEGFGSAVVCDKTKSPIVQDGFVLSQVSESRPGAPIFLLGLAIAFSYAVTGSLESTLTGVSQPKRSGLRP